MCPNHWKSDKFIVRIKKKIKKNKKIKKIAVRGGEKYSCYATRSINILQISRSHTFCSFKFTKICMLFWLRIWGRAGAAVGSCLAAWAFVGSGTKKAPFGNLQKGPFWRLIYKLFHLMKQ
jgi:hypothetical protein